jgi:voltage-gated potassium channel
MSAYRQITQGEMAIRRLRVVRAAILVAGVLVVGSLGFYFLTDREHSFLECVYMTVITVTTVGYEEVVPVRESQTLTLFTLGVMLVGVGAVLYLLTAVAAMVVEGDLQQRLWRRRMEKRIENLRDHIIVVGIGRCGSQVIRELFNAGVPFVAVDIEPTRLELLVQDLHMECPVTVGDAMEDTILRAAGIERARGLVATLHDDRDNLFLCLTARHLNPRLRLVAKADERSSFAKFEKVGVNAIVSPPVMGGRHIASEMLRPDVASFVDGLLRVTESAPALSELRVDDAAPAAGKTLGEANLRARTNCLILGIRDDRESFYQYNPGPDVILAPGASVIALGDPVALESLRNLLQAGT